MPITCLHRLFEGVESPWVVGGKTIQTEESCWIGTSGCICGGWICASVPIPFSSPRTLAITVSGTGNNLRRLCLWLVCTHPVPTPPKLYWNVSRIPWEFLSLLSEFLLAAFSRTSSLSSTDKRKNDLAAYHKLADFLRKPRRQLGTSVHHFMQIRGR